MNLLELKFVRLDIAFAFMNILLHRGLNVSVSETNQDMFSFRLDTETIKDEITPIIVFYINVDKKQAFDIGGEWNAKVLNEDFPEEHKKLGPVIKNFIYPVYDLMMGEKALSIEEFYEKYVDVDIEFSDFI